MCWHWIWGNNSLPWSVDFYNKYIDKINYESLSKNNCLPWIWTIPFIEKHKMKINWNFLSSNTSIPFNLELIEKFQDKWNWRLLSQNESINWNNELIDKFHDKWRWDGYWGFSNNNSLPWSIEFIKKYNEKFGKYTSDISKSSTPLWKTLEPFIDEELINEVFEHIKLKN